MPLSLMERMARPEELPGLLLMPIPLKNERESVRTLGTGFSSSSSSWEELWNLLAMGEEIKPLPD